jgi:hypothetical protein
VDKQELADLPPSWSDAQRGQYLERLLRSKGIDPGRLFRVEYYPYHLCWLVYQEYTTTPGIERTPAATGTLILSEFRRTARSACTRAAAHSLQFARFGCKYRLPPAPEELTPADLVDQLGGIASRESAVRFDPEGGWQEAKLNRSPGRR